MLIETVTIYHSAWANQKIQGDGTQRKIVEKFWKITIYHIIIQLSKSENNEHFGSLWDRAKMRHQ